MTGVLQKARRTTRKERNRHWNSTYGHVSTTCRRAGMGFLWNGANGQTPRTCSSARRLNPSGANTAAARARL